MALIVAFGLSAASLRAEQITPDSIANPPAAVGSADLTFIPSTSNLVTTQYLGLGLNFSPTVGSLTAITNLNGVTVWAPGVPLMQPLSRISGADSPVGQINYNGTWNSGGLVQPGSMNPQTASSVTLEIIGRPVGVNLLGSGGQFLGSATQSGVGPHGGELYTFTGSGITSFQVDAPVIDPGPGVMAINPAWGVAGVSFTPSNTPEPTSFLLAGMGGVGLVLRLGWRRLQLRS
jgi:hypothetical protein